MRGLLRGMAGLALTATTVASAADAPPDPTTPALATILISGGVDSWQRGAFGYAGALWSPAGLDVEGFTLKLATGGGVYRYRSGFLGDDAAQADQFVASLLPGWRFKGAGYELLVTGGLDVQTHTPRASDPTARLHGTYAGARAGADLWLQPAAEWMLAANASVSTISQSYWYRLAPGLRLGDVAWVGPEALLLGDAHYTQTRIGLHLTGLRTGPLEWSGGVGHAQDSERKRGAYIRFGVLTRR